MDKYKDQSLMGDDVCKTWMNQYKGKANVWAKEPMAFDCENASNKEETCFMYNVEADAEEDQATGQVCETGECWSIVEGKARRMQDAGETGFPARRTLVILAAK